MRRKATTPSTKAGCRPRMTDIEGRWQTRPIVASLLAVSLAGCTAEVTSPGRTGPMNGVGGAGGGGSGPVPPITPVSGTQIRLRLLTEAEYVGTVQNLLGGGTNLTLP